MHSFPIRYDEPHPIDDVVTIAVAPIDAFSGRITEGRLRVEVEGLIARPIRNLSGLRVFVNLPPQPEYRIRIEAGEAGYYDPPVTTFPPSPPTGNEPRLDVYLHRRPEFPFDPDTTIVFGQLVEGADDDPVDGATIRADLPTVPGGTPPFVTQSDANGSFALPLRMPADLLPADLVTFTFDAPGMNRQFAKFVREGVRNTFIKPIRMDGANTPDLRAFAGAPVP